MAINEFHQEFIEEIEKNHVLENATFIEFFKQTTNDLVEADEVIGNPEYLHLNNLYHETNVVRLMVTFIMRMMAF